MSSFGQVEVDFPLFPFRPELFRLTLEPNQIAIIGLERRTENGTVESHYLCSDRSEIFAGINSGGISELRKCLSEGFEFSDVIVFEKVEKSQG